MKQNIKEQRLLDLQWVRRALLLLLGDIAIIAIASVGALIARFDFSYSSIDAEYLESMYHYLPIHMVTTLLVFYFCKMYHSLWKFVSIHELGYILLANVVSFFMQVSFVTISYSQKLFFCGNFVADCDGCRNTIFLSFLPILKGSKRTAIWLRTASKKSYDYWGRICRPCHY